MPHEPVPPGGSKMEAQAGILSPDHSAEGQDFVLSFGKHKGKPIKQIDDRYLRWMQGLESSWWREIASNVLEQRRQEQVTSKKFILAELKVCRNLQRGKDIHAMAVETGNDTCSYIATAIVKMYGKCGSMADARKVFDRIKHPDVVLWTAFILGYVQNGEGVTALDQFARMKSRGCAPDSFACVAALKACTSLALENNGSGRAACFERGKQIHFEIGCRSNIYVQNTLIDMYGKCGSMCKARQVFDSIKKPDLVSWNALISGYAENGEATTALNLFARMRTQGYVPDCITFVVSLKACASLALDEDETGRAECLERGKQIHLEIGGQLDMFMQTTLVYMYAKCGSMVDARKVFDSMKRPDVVAWNALIMGYADSGEAVNVLNLLARMKLQGCTPDCITFVAALKASALLGAFESGSKIHAEIDTETEGDVILVTCLVDFYAKCGNLVKAQDVFDSHPRTRDLTTWTALLAGYSRLGDTKAVFELFKAMQDADIQPDGITFLCILTCCSHAGLVDKANEFFEFMTRTSAVSPSVEHCACMVDILGRSNRLDDAISLLRGMSCRPLTVTWLTVLGACRKWKNVGIGRLAFESLMSLDDSNGAAYTLMAHIYGSRGMREEQALVLSMRKTFRAWKVPGRSLWTSDVGDVHSFSDDS